MLIFFRFLLFILVLYSLLKFLRLVLFFFLCKKKEQDELITLKSQELLKCSRCGCYVSRESLQLDSIKKNFFCKKICVV